MQKLLALACLILIWITPIGSNNALYPVYNNLFLVAPVTIHCAYELFSLRSQNDGFSDGLPLSYMDCNFNARKSLWPAFLTLLFVLIIQGIRFSTAFTFHDGDKGGLSMRLLEGGGVYDGMYTNFEQADSLEALSAFFFNVTSENEIAGNSVFQKTRPGLIVYNDIPGLIYMLNAQNALSNAWPDLPSFPIEDFRKELSQIEHIENVIVIIKTDKRVNQADEKYKVLTQFIQSNNMHPVYSNKSFVVYKVTAHQKTVTFFQK